MKTKVGGVEGGDFTSGVNIDPRNLVNPDGEL